MEFIEAPLFTHLLPEYLSDDGYRKLQVHLARDPEVADLSPDDKRLLKTAMERETRQRAQRRGTRRE